MTARRTAERPLHISIVAIPDAVISTLSGIFDVLNTLPSVVDTESLGGRAPPFELQIVGERPGEVALASGLPIATHTSIERLARSDIVIVPSLLVTTPLWESGRYPDLVDWAADNHARGATLCSACSGIFLLAETGLFDGVDATVHWSYAHKFAKSFPNVPVNPERVLVAAGSGERLLSSGASASWHDLVLYLVARHVSPAAAHATAKFYALQWHQEGLAPYIVFDPPTDHGDALVAATQNWLAGHYTLRNVLESAIERAGLPERSFKRRFTNATGFAPIAYVQRLRIEQAKRELESTARSVDEISWQVGYDDPAFFRKLFKRTAGMAPAAYRRKFRVPEFSAN